MAEHKERFRQKMEGVTEHVSSVLSKGITYAQQLREGIVSTEGVYIASLTSVIVSGTAQYVEMFTNKGITGSLLLASTMTFLSFFPMISAGNILDRQGKSIFKKVGL